MLTSKLGSIHRNVSYREKFKDNKGGPLYYFGNRALTLPEDNGHMYPDFTWMKDSFAIIEKNRGTRPFNRCFEPFAGSASWSFTAMELGFSQEYFINDANETLIHFFKMARNNPNILKKEYALLSTIYSQSTEKVALYQQIIDQYNNSSDARKSLLLPFIINHAWGGMVFYNQKGALVYQKITIKNQEIAGCIKKPSLTNEEFNTELDRISRLLNENIVHFSSLDFQKSLIDIGEEDFVVLNPPYPENQRSIEREIGLYVEIHSPEKLHRDLCDMIKTFELKGVTYLMSYGIYNPELSNYIIRAPDGTSTHYLRLIGKESSSFGELLDQIYFNRGYKVPSQLKHKITFADEILLGRNLTHAEAFQEFYKRATL